MPERVWKLAVLAVMGLAATGCSAKTQQKQDTRRESISYSCLSPSLTLNGNQIEAEFKVRLQGKDIRYSKTCREYDTATGEVLGDMDRMARRGDIFSAAIVGSILTPLALTLDVITLGEAGGEVCDSPERIAEEAFIEEAEPAEGQFVGTLTIVNDNDPTEQHVKHLNGPVSVATVPVASPSAGYLVHLRGQYKSEHLECAVDEQKLVEPGT